MYRQLFLRPARPIVYLGVARSPIISQARTVVTPPPPSSSSSQGQTGSSQTPPPQPEGSNTLIILSALGALGGLYYYYTRGQPAVDREEARRKEEEVERKVKEMGEAGRSKADSIAKQGQRDYSEFKAGVRDGASGASDARTDLTERARHDTQVKLDELKSAAERKIGDVRDRSEKEIEEGKEEAARLAHEAKNKTRSWFGWGSSK